jgi:hypothetical protein
VSEQERQTVEVSLEDLVRWAAVATVADSYLSLIYHRGGITEWDTAATPTKEGWERAMAKARNASDELRMLLSWHGVDDHAVAREMDRANWLPQQLVAPAPEAAGREEGGCDD